MGYRSEVAINISKEDFNEYFVNKKELKDLLEYGKIYQNDNIVVMHWDSVKWYEEYTDISLVMDLLNVLEEIGHPYTFIRLGESIGDTEFLNNIGSDGTEFGFDYIDYVSYINVPTNWEIIKSIEKI